MRRMLVVLVALLSVSGRLQAQDSIPAPPDTSTVTPADSLVPGSLAGLTPLQRDSARNAARPVSPLGALGRSILIPGWGQAKLNRKLTGAIFITVEAISLGMAIKASNELDYLRRTQSTRADAKAIFYLNVNDHLAGANGRLLEGMTIDQLHLTAKGYQLEQM